MRKEKAINPNHKVQRTIRIRAISAIRSCSKFKS